MDNEYGTVALIDRESTTGKTVQKKKRKIAIASLCAALLVLLGSAALTFSLAQRGAADEREKAYRTAVALLEQGELGEAGALLEQLGDYRDSGTLLQNIPYDSQYARAMENFANEDYLAAAADFRTLGNYKDAREKLSECRALFLAKAAYTEGMDRYKDGEWADAYRVLTPFCDAGYRDTAELLSKIRTNSENYLRHYAKNGDSRRALAFLMLLDEIDPDAGSALREEFFPAAAFEPDQSFFYLDTAHKTSFTANTPEEEFASVVLYMMLHGQMGLSMMSNKPVTRSTLEAKAFRGANLAQEMLPGYGSVYNPSVIIGDNYVRYTLTHEQELSEHQRTMNIKTFKAFCEDSVRQLTEMGLLTDAMTRREKADVIINWVGFYLTYDQSLTIHDVGIAIEQKRGVCESFAALYNRMCNLAGIPTYGQIGHVQGVGHIWSFHIDENGEIFYADSTWADPWKIDFGGDAQEEPTIELFARRYLAQYLRSALTEQYGYGSGKLPTTETTRYCCSDTLWLSHVAERSAAQIIAYHDKITGKAE